MKPDTASAMLRTLGSINLQLGQLSPTYIPEPVPTVDELTNQEQRVIVGLLTALLGRPPVDSEIHAATAL